MRRLCRSIALAAVATLLIVTSVFASYYIQIIVEESTGTDYTQLAMNMTLDIDGLVDGGYISANGTDTRVTDAGYNVLPHMLAEDKIMWVSNLGGNTTTQFIFFMGQDALESLPIIAGHGGYVTVNDTAELELGGIYAIAIVGYVDTSAGANKNIARKDGAYNFTNPTANVLIYTVVGGNSLNATGVSSGYMTIMVYSDGFEMWMEIDDAEQDRDMASLVPDTASDLILFENDVMPYTSYFSVWIV